MLFLPQHKTNPEGGVSRARRHRAAKEPPFFQKKQNPYSTGAGARLITDFVNWWARFRLENDRSHLKTTTKVWQISLIRNHGGIAPTNKPCKTE